MKTLPKSGPSAFWAVAGALALVPVVSGPALAQGEPDGSGRKLTATLTGAAEVPGPGDPNGAGLFEGRVNPGQGRICYVLTAGNIDDATVAHIHIGGRTASGPPVLTLEDTPGEDDDDSEACQDIDRSLAQQLIQNPEGYYVNVHTEEFPDGAIRGQLSK